MNIDFDNDFGFSLVSEEEIDAVQQAKSEVKNTKKKLSESGDKATKMYEAILPLLENLKKNPEKEYIKWPNRIEKIDLFIGKLQKLLEE